MGWSTPNLDIGDYSWKNLDPGQWMRGSQPSNPNALKGAPSWSASQPYHVGVGGYRLDMRDPRVLAALAVTPMNPVAGASMLAYAGGRQVDNQRQDKRLEKEYLPRADAQARLGNQSAAFGGLQGGVGQAMGQRSFESVLAQLLEEKRAVRERQMQEEMQAAQSLMALLPFLA